MTPAANGRHLNLALALLAGAVMLFEIALLRVFSFAIWHHFAFMVMTIALFGFAVSGILLSLRPAPVRAARQRAAGHAGLFCLTAVLAVGLLRRVDFDPTRIGHSPAEILKLCLICSIFVIPFTMAGFAVVGLLHGFSDKISRLYASDLIGAGLMCILSVPVLNTTGAEGAIMLAASMGAVSAFLLELGSQKPTRGTVWFGLALVCALFSLWTPRVFLVPAGRAKALHRWLDRSRFPEARLVDTQYNALSRIDVVQGSGAVAWLQNPHVVLQQPEQIQIVIDGDAATPVVKLGDRREDLDSLDFALSSAGLQAWRPQRVLIIGAGGGVDVAMALRHGATQVDAVEVNGDVIRLATERYAEFNGGLFQRPEVSVYADEGRHFVRRQTGAYDLIQLSLVDTWAASAAGAYSLAESYLYTVEAFSDYLDRLSPDGVLTIARWLWHPPREMLRLFTIATEALRTQGVENPETHLVVIGLGPFGNLLVKRKPFVAEDLLALAQVALQRRFRLVYTPMGTQGTAFHDFTEARDKAAFYASYPYDVRPATDDSPFFFQFGRWRDANPFGRGWRDRPFVLSGRLVLLTVLLQALIFSAVLALAAFGARQSRNRLRDRARVWPRISYFFLIGLAFMFAEVSSIQKFTLFLGHPVYSVAFVLAVLLVSAGTGSAFAPRIGLLGRKPWPLFAALVALLCLYAQALPGLFRWSLGMPLAARMVLGLALLVPLGFLAGMPFPLALGRLSKSSDKLLVGFSWAANGCGSVMGPVMATMMAMDFGLRMVMLTAGGLYAVALLAFRNW